MYARTIVHSDLLVIVVVIVMVVVVVVRRRHVKASYRDEWSQLAACSGGVHENSHQDYRGHASRWHRDAGLDLGITGGAKALHLCLQPPHSRCRMFPLLF
jgi:hypothetical protein